MFYTPEVIVQVKTLFTDSIKNYLLLWRSLINFSLKT